MDFHNNIGANNNSALPLDSTFFIQRMTSAEIVYHPKQMEPKIISHYILGDIIGEGSYGKVREGFSMQTLRRVAVKIMKGKKLKKIPNGVDNVKREISLLRRIQHPNIVELIEVLYNDAKEKMYVVMEFCIGGIQDLVEKSAERRLCPDEARHYFIQLVNGLSFMHSKCVIHRDIKPGNLLLAVDGTLKISDFGVADNLSMFCQSSVSNSTAGSPAFQPPEIASGQESFDGTKVDVWSAGVTLFYMVTGQYPFKGANVFNLFENIVKSEFVCPNNIDPLLGDLLKRMLTKDPAERISVQEISTHPWMLVQVPYSVTQNYVDVLKKDRPATSLIPYLDYLFADEEMKLPQGNMLDNDDLIEQIPKKRCTLL